jgi:peptidyl-prolyl cis-trans isomerase B (cyclophilin B)
MVADAKSLDGQYAAFGKVTEGIEVVDKIVGAERDSNDKPLESVVMRKVTVDLKGKTYSEPVKK